MSITTQAADVFRDMASPGSTVPHEPEKLEIRELFADVDLSIAQAAGGVRAYATYAALAADTSQPARTYAVVSTADGGTHTDPVVGGTVNNSGYYTYSTSPAGWQRLFSVFPGATYVPCTVTVVGAYWLVTPKTGFEAVNVGADQVFFGIAPAASSGSLAVRVVGINDADERVVKLADGTTTVTTGDILIDGFFAIKYHPTGTRAGLFQLVDGLVGSGGSGGSTAIIQMAQTQRLVNTVDLAAATGFELPNNTGDDTIMLWEVEADGEPEASWLFNVAGINGPDSYLVKYRDGTALAPTTPKAGDRIFFGRPGAVGNFFTILQHWKADTPQDGGDGLSAYQTIALQGAGSRAATAERLARRKLNIADPAFTGVLSIGDATAQGSDPAFLHARTITSAMVSPHAFSDSAALSFSTGLAYNSFESRFQVTGTGNYDHFAGFQANFDVDTTGATTNVWCFFAAPIIDTGTATNAIGFEFYGFRGTGTITNGYGLVIADLDALMSGGGGTVTNTYAIDQRGVGDLNRFAGRMDVANYIRATNNTTVPPTGAGLELNYNTTTSGGLGSANIIAYDRTPAAAVPWKQMTLAALFFSVRPEGTERFLVNTSGAFVTSGGLGYGTGVGGTVTQATSKSTGVTLNKSCGQITLNAASLAAGASVSFTLTSSIIAATDVVSACIKSGATAGAYTVQVDAVGAGTCQMSLRNHSGGALAEAVVLSFAIIKASIA